MAKEEAKKIVSIAPTLKSKTVRRKPEPVRSELIKVPAHILAKNRKVILDIDTFYINKLPLLTTLSQHLNFATAQHILNRNVTTILDGLISVFKLYISRGFHITTVNGDNEFEPLREHLLSLGVQVNICSANEHVPRIERINR